jgi:6-phosphogluconolactonase (cycloisomerase 2 family)
MKSKQLACVLLSVFGTALALLTTSCTSNSIGYLFVTSDVVNKIYSVHVNGNNGTLMLNSGSVGSGGMEPTREVLTTGGQWLYVLNMASGQINVFSVGSEGALTIQPQLVYTGSGANPTYITTDTSGSYIYEIEQYQASCAAEPDAATTCPGEITAFSINSNTGQLTRIQNQQTYLYYFPVGIGPIAAAPTNGYLYTLDQVDRDIYIYQIEAGSQLVPGLTPTVPVGVSPTAIIVSGSYLYVADPGASAVWSYTLTGTGGTPIGTVPPVTCTYQPGGNCVGLVGTGASAVRVDPLGKFAYVTDAGSNEIEAFTVTTTCTSPGQGACGSLQAVSGSPYPTGGGPQCIAITSSPEYIYTADTDGTVTGSQVNTSTGQLTSLGPPGTVMTGGQNACLIYSTKR